MCLGIPVSFWCSSLRESVVAKVVEGKVVEGKAVEEGSVVESEKGGVVDLEMDWVVE